MDYKNILNILNNNGDYNINEIISEKPNSSYRVEKSLLAYLYDLQFDGNDDPILQQLIETLEQKNAICTEYSEIDEGVIDYDEEGHDIYSTRYEHVRNKTEFLQSRLIAAIQMGNIEKLTRIVKQGGNLNEDLAIFESFKEEYSDRTEINAEETHKIREMKQHPLYYVFTFYPGPSIENRLKMIEFISERCGNINNEDINIIRKTIESNPNCRSNTELHEKLDQALKIIQERTKDPNNTKIQPAAIAKIALEGTSTTKADEANREEQTALNSSKNIKQGVTKDGQ